MRLEAGGGGWWFFERSGKTDLFEVCGYGWLDSP